MSQTQRWADNGVSTLRGDFVRILGTWLLNNFSSTDKYTLSRENQNSCDLIDFYTGIRASDPWSQHNTRT